jgi:uncharacterized protein (DUF2336 family)
MSQTDRLTYDQARAIASDLAPARRVALADRPDAPPEILYFLASDPEQPVRRSVAANRGTPALGNLVLAGDEAAEVRRALAEKIRHHGRYCGIGLQQLRARSVADLVVEKLAGDRDASIRVAMAETIKDASDVARKMVRNLAFDEVLAVAAPVLEHSPILSSDDLLELLATAPDQGRLAAISRRRVLDERVAAMLVASRDVPTLTNLLGSSSANVQEVTLDTLIDAVAEELGLPQQPVFRRDLSDSTVQSLVERVAHQLGALFPNDQDMPAGARSAIQAMVEKRLAQPGDKVRGAAAASFAEDADERFHQALDRAEAQAAAQQLDEATLRVYLLTGQDEDLIAGLAVRADLSLRTVLHLIAAQSARAMSALAWRAGLSAEFALELQQRLASVAADSVIPPKDDGGYPIEEEEMIWQLSMFGIDREDRRVDPAPEAQDAVNR